MKRANKLVKHRPPRRRRNGKAMTEDEYAQEMAERQRRKHILEVERQRLLATKEDGS